MSIAAQHIAITVLYLLGNVVAIKLDKENKIAYAILFSGWLIALTIMGVIDIYFGS